MKISNVSSNYNFKEIKLSFGKSIRIYLKDGTVTGIKFGEVVNQTIQSVSCPRMRIAELGTYTESQRPGVYFLFGEDEETGEAKVYIGEAENVYTRLQQHVGNKEFWNDVIFFVSKDENLTKSHVKYLESRLIEIAFRIKRYKIENYNQATQSLLPAADRDAMEEFLTYVKLLIGVHGHKILEEVIAPQKKSTEITVPITEATQNFIETSEPLQLFMSISNLKASAIQTDEGIVVLKDSEATQNPTDSLGIGYRALRDKLIESGKIKSIGEKCGFLENVLFNSPSAASSAVLGYNSNGRFIWKDKNGKSLKEIEEQKIK